MALGIDEQNRIWAGEGSLGWGYVAGWPIIIWGGHFLESLPALHNQLQTRHIPVGKFPRKGVPLEWRKNYVSFLCSGLTRSQQGALCKPQPR